MHKERAKCRKGKKNGGTSVATNIVFLYMYTRIVQVCSVAPLPSSFSAVLSSIVSWES